MRRCGVLICLTMMTIGLRSIHISAFATISRRHRPFSLHLRSSELSTDTSTTTVDVSNTPTQEGFSTSPSPPKTKRILSGIQPTGTIHLGNYLGAIQQWVQYQNSAPPGENNFFFCVVDLHAITQPHVPEELQQSSRVSAALYLAAGIDPAKGSKIFLQSHVPAHAELTWLLQCMTPVNWLERMIQYKEKSQKAAGGSVSTGLMTYPILMAADILLYQATEVPVGEDQRQHLELARDIVRRFHDLYCRGNAFKRRMKEAGLPSRPVFTEPNAMIVSDTGRIMSLTDGRSKMSKSDPNDLSRINLLDSPDRIREKIQKCKTDAAIGIVWDDPERPEATNLLNIYAAVQPHRTRDDIAQEVADLTWGAFKPRLADALIAHLQPIQERYAAIDTAELDAVLRDGAAAAHAIAATTLQATKVAMGFVTPLNDDI
jgi:tryptophanyl-tRNA synthetase